MRGSVVNLAMGTPSRAISPAAVGVALRAAGLSIAGVVPLAADARGSAPFIANTDKRGRLFVKALSNEDRDADWLFKAVRHILYREVEDESPFASPKQQAEHEAFLTLQAARAGANVVDDIDIVNAPPNHVLIVQDVVEGTTLDKLDAGVLTDERVAAILAQMSVLHRHGIAHRDLRLASIMLSPEGVPKLIDFGFAEVSASQARLARDAAELTAALSAVIGVDRVAVAAVRAVEPGLLEASLRFMAPAALPLRPGEP